MRKYLLIFRLAARDQLIYLPSFLVKNLFFVVLVFVFWSLWRVVFAGRGVIAGMTLVQTLWYLTFTEAVELSKSRAMFLVQQEVKDGTVAINLSRPYSYVLFHFFRCMGESFVKTIPILLEGFVLAVLFVGPLPGYAGALPFGFLLILLGVALTNLWLLAVGLLAFWTEEVAPFYWVIQKLVFILGGLFLPIDIFPAGVAAVAKYLPFAFCAYWPASTIVNFRPRTFLTGLGGAVVYLVVIGGLAALAYHRGRRKVGVQGG